MPPKFTPAQGTSKPPYRPRPPETPEVRISKFLSKVLRHRADEFGLQVRSDGYVRVDDILKLKQLQSLSCDVAKLKEIVRDNNKSRFTLSYAQDPSISKTDPTETGITDPEDAIPIWIKANQGHSIQVEELELEEITSPSQIPVCIHGTFSQSFPSIVSTGLSPMSRTHIHLASGLPGDPGVISGIRPTCDTFIYVDVQKAIEGGVRFWKSPNGVILTKGDEDGRLGNRFWEKVTNKKGELVQF